MQDYQKVIRKELEEELDYRLEVKRLRKVYEAFKGYEGISIPEPYEDECGERYILMSWEDSMPLDEFLDKAEHKEKVKVVKSLLHFFVENLFALNCVHADPNLGNYGFRKQGDEVSLVVYDYGSLVDTPEHFPHYLCKLMEAVEQGKGDPLPWYVGMGFNETLLRPLHEKLLAFSDLLLEPILSSSRYNLREWNRKERAEQILGDHRWNFMTAAPAELLPFMRSIQGLFNYISKLDVGLFARPMIEEKWRLLDAELRDLRTPEVQDVLDDCSMASNLCIKVIEDGRVKVSLAMPRASIENLEDIMDEDVKKKLCEENIELDEVVKKARASGYQSMNLFEVQKGNKEIQVFLN